MSLAQPASASMTAESPAPNLTVTADGTVINNDSHWKYSRGVLVGVGSGMTKLVLGHPFDTIKVRMQLDQGKRFTSAMDCFRQTIRTEGLRALYKGATPPLLGWGIIDSLLWGSMVQYRSWLEQYNVDQFTAHSQSDPMNSYTPAQISQMSQLSFLQHCIAGGAAGLTSTIVVTPIEQVKARLQVQYADPSTIQYKGPIDCVRQLVRNNGVIGGLYHGYAGTVLFRLNMSYYFASYEVLKRWAQPYDSTYQSTGKLSLVNNFGCGVAAAMILWLLAYPTDCIKNMMMAQPDTNPRRYPTVRDCIRITYQTKGIRGFYAGFVPGILRAIPVNGGALVVSELLLQNLPTGE